MNMNWRKVLSGLMGITVTGFLIVACDDDDGEDIIASIGAGDQYLSQNIMHVNSVTLDGGNGWLVALDNKDGEPDETVLLADEVGITEGTTNDIEIDLTNNASIHDEDTIWLKLYLDIGNPGEFDRSIDPPVKSGGQYVEAPVIVKRPQISVEDQPIQNNQVVIDEVVAAVDGWLVIHADNGLQAPGDVVGYTFVNKGNNSNVIVSFTNPDIESGMILFPMLHIDAGSEGEYEFPGADIPEVFGFGSNNIVLTSFTVQ